MTAGGSAKDPKGEQGAQRTSRPAQLRGRRLREAVLTATLDLLSSEGLAAVSVNAVAKAAGVHETSVYRHWGTREQLIHDALSTHTVEALPTPDTGDVRQDLTELFAAVARYLLTPQGAALLQLGVSAAGNWQDAGLRAYWESRLDRGEAVVHRGVERGELDADTDPRLLVEMIGALLFVRTLTGAPVDERVAATAVAQVLDGARPLGTRGGERTRA
ncbi:TetR/AcrR family transcriptional regulator [Streptomyces sp. NPDC091272]|uniref:TetR/AcrR family transcriptional regulator n=1 Tax=Streptomyces sp. NPDC091272 TaxID=3365981 RepID=UPI0038008480